MWVLYSPGGAHINSKQHILENYCTYADDYGDFIKGMEDPDRLKKADYVIQFPYVAPVRVACVDDALLTGW